MNRRKQERLHQFGEVAKKARYRKPAEPWTKLDKVKLIAASGACFIAFMIPVVVMIAKKPDQVLKRVAIWQSRLGLTDHQATRLRKLERDFHKVAVRPDSLALAAHRNDLLSAVRPEQAAEFSRMLNQGSNF